MATLVQQKYYQIIPDSLHLEDLGFYIHSNNQFDSKHTKFYFQKANWNKELFSFKSDLDKASFIRYLTFHNQVDFTNMIDGSTIRNGFKVHWSDDQIVLDLQSGWFLNSPQKLLEFYQNISKFLPLCIHWNLAVIDSDWQYRIKLPQFCPQCLQPNSCQPKNLISKSFYLEKNVLLRKLLYDLLSQNLPLPAELIEYVLSFLTLEDYLSKEIVQLLPLKLNCKKW